MNIFGSFYEWGEGEGATYNIKVRSSQKIPISPAILSYRGRAHVPVLLEVNLDYHLKARFLRGLDEVDSELRHSQSVIFEPSGT